MKISEERGFDMGRSRKVESKSPEYEILGRNIAAAREQFNISQAEAARRIGIPQGTYSGYETGTRRVNLSMLKRIADCYGVTIDILIGSGTVPNPSEFSTRIRNLRKKNGMTQDDLSARLDLTKQAVSQWERGIREPDFATLEKIADFFGVETDYLIGRTAAPAALNQTERSLISAFRDLSPAEQRLILRSVGISQ